MRKLILQMQMSVDGFVGTLPGRHVPWQVWNWSDEWSWDQQLKAVFNRTLADVDTILLSRPVIVEGYLDHWTGVAARKLDSLDFAFARRIVEATKVVATTEMMHSRWDRTIVSTGPLSTSVQGLKKSSGSERL